VSGYSQDNPFWEGDSIEVSKGFLTFSDSLAVDSTLMMDFMEKDVLTKDVFKPNPTKAVLYSAIFPGLGQIYNRKYWKLPIVYGGFMGCAYAISWNSNQYSGYKSAYGDFNGKDPNAKNAAWRAYKPYSSTRFPDDLSAWTEQDKNWFSNALKNKKDFYRRYKELSIIITAGVYVICMIDAYVDAQLFEFDISEDLSMKVDPVIFEKSTNNSRSFGLQCSFTF
jgi:hypothetical protein